MTLDFFFNLVQFYRNPQKLGGAKMNEKILEKLKDKEFAKKIIGIESEENVIKAFKEENIDISKKEVEELGNIVSDIISKFSEMPEDQLEKVSGGDLQDAVDNVVDIYTLPGQIMGHAVKKATPNSGDSVLDDGAIGNAAFLAVTALQTYGIYKGGKWAINKGKQWWQNRKQK